MFNALLREVVPKNLKIPVNIAFSPLSGCKESLMGGSRGAVSTLDSRGYCNCVKLTLTKTSTGDREEEIDQ